MLHRDPLDHRAVKHCAAMLHRAVVERPAYSVALLQRRAVPARGDTSFYSILHCNYMESVATGLLNKGGTMSGVAGVVGDGAVGEDVWCGEGVAAGGNERLDAMGL